jgi:DNA-directed RNA polymerase subunit RPC12/RpoP
MKKSDDPKIKAIRWVLDLLADDLDSLSDLDLSKRILEAMYYFGEKIVLTGETPPEFWREVLKRIQLHLRGFLKSLEEVTEHVLASKDKHYSEELPSSLEVEIFFNIDPEKMTISYEPPWTRRTVDDEYVHISDAVFSDQKIVAYFYSLFDGLPTGAIKSCRECKKYFLHLSKKPKFFCSPQCGSRYLSRERREKDPEGYRAKQREIMRKKYREKKAEERGVSVDKVKIQERVKKK